MAKRMAGFKSFYPSANELGIWSGHTVEPLFWAFSANKKIPRQPTKKWFNAKIFSADERYCPACRHDDLQSVGYAFRRVIHQVTVVHRCFIHCSELMVRCRECVGENLNKAGENSCLACKGTGWGNITRRMSDGERALQEAVEEAFRGTSRFAFQRRRVLKDQIDWLVKNKDIDLKQVFSHFWGTSSPSNFSEWINCNREDFLSATLKIPLDYSINPLLDLACVVFSEKVLADFNIHVLNELSPRYKNGQSRKSDDARKKIRESILQIAFPAALGEESNFLPRGNA